MTQSETIEVPAQFLKDLYEIKCVPDLKAALEKHFEEVVKPEEEKWPEDPFGYVFINHETHQAYIGSSALVEKSLTNLDGTTFWSDYSNANKIAKKKLRLMRSGTITIKVRNGKIAGATVLED